MFPDKTELNLPYKALSLRLCCAASFSGGIDTHPTSPMLVGNSLKLPPG